MPRKLFLLVAVSIQFTFSVYSQRNLISNELNRVGTGSLMSAAFHQFPYFNEREKWNNIPMQLKESYIREADQFIGYTWPALPATLFLEYSKTGNRSHYERVDAKRRDVLATLVIAECIDHKGKYLNDIVNGIWSICEQSYWGYPAHLSMQKKQYGLPDVNEPTVDLFAAETASLIAWTYYFLGEQLNSISPAVSERMIYETGRRILEPVLNRTDFWWMGYGSRTVNNWNPWIISNWLTCALIMEKDQTKKDAHLKKIASTLDHFINAYPDDGGCDEGPGYWNRAGGSLYDCLEMLYQASDGSFNIFSNPLVKNIGAYIYKAHIAGRYYLNFADASAINDIDPSIVFGYGTRISNDTLMNLASEAFKDKIAGKDYDNNGSMYRRLMMIFNYKNLEDFSNKIPGASTYWLNQTGVLTVRSVNNGLFLGAQGGHNNESHNHNDVGNFVVYYQGKPALIDVGVETYTAKTFSDKRYEIWTMQSAFHNCPTVNGVMQSPGREFAAKNVQFNSSGDNVNLSMNIEDAYPDEAGITTWKRTWNVIKNKSITITDDFKLNSSKGETYFTLMSAKPVEITNDKLVIKVDEGNEIQVSFDRKNLTPEVESISISDPRLKNSWGEKIYRIKLHLKKNVTSGKIKMVVTGKNN